MYSILKLWKYCHTLKNHDKSKQVLWLKQNSELWWTFGFQSEKWIPLAYIQYRYMLHWQLIRPHFLVITQRQILSNYQILNHTCSKTTSKRCKPLSLHQVKLSPKVDQYPSTVKRNSSAFQIKELHGTPSITMTQNVANKIMFLCINN